MSIFQDWLKRRDYREASFDRMDSDDFAKDFDRLQNELMKTVFTKYPEETMQFLEGIAQRGDQEINNMLKQLRSGNRPMQNKEPQHPSDGDEVVPAAADTGYNNSFGGD